MYKFVGKFVESEELLFVFQRDKRREKKSYCRLYAVQCKNKTQ